ncbi:hypothetical protein TNCV_3724311 [Trichonephila clavipes]|nr:hypothetical protein TNCV_3724311 [Trichonephila clavipes]
MFAYDFSIQKIYRFQPMSNSRLAKQTRRPVSHRSRRNRDYKGMWVRLGSTDLMAGKVMFLRSNQGDRLDGNDSVAVLFEVIWSALKSWSGATILGAFLHSYVCQEKPSSREAHSLPEITLSHSSYSQQISTTLVIFNVSFTNMLINKYNCYHCTIDC